MTARCSQRLTGTCHSVSVVKLLREITLNHCAEGTGTPSVFSWLIESNSDMLAVRAFDSVGYSFGGAGFLHRLTHPNVGM